ncbi:MAG: hypothetical protein ACYS8W_20945 [Planctomycetota bacterium]|jgi:hypothetical protein
MASPRKKDIILSSNAMEELFRLNLQQWSLSVGLVNFSKTIGVLPPRINSAISDATLSFDLACRINVCCGVSWPTIFMGINPGITFESIQKAEKERKLDSVKSLVEEIERGTRNRLREIVEKEGFTRTSGLTGYAKSTLHGYLKTTRLSLALVWRIHLMTGIPFTEIITGKEDPDEQAYRARLESPSEFKGILHSLDEPICELVRLYCFDYASIAGVIRKPYITHMEKLRKNNLSPAQRSRLLYTLSIYRHQSGNKTKAVAYINEGRKALKNAGNSPLDNFLKLRQAGLEIEILTQEKNKGLEKIIKHARDPRIVSQAYRMSAEVNFMRYNIFEAHRLIRKAIDTAHDIKSQNASFIRTDFEVHSAVCQYLMGDYRGSLDTVRRLFRSGTPWIITRLNSHEIEMYISIWLGKVTVAERLIKSIGKCAAAVTNILEFQTVLDLYRLRCLLLRRDSGLSYKTSDKKRTSALVRKAGKINADKLRGDNYVIFAICMYRAKNDSKHLKRLLGKLVSGKLMFPNAPLLSLPDLVETAKLAGLWKSPEKKWARKVSEKGLLIFNMKR